MFSTLLAASHLPALRHAWPSAWPSVCTVCHSWPAQPVCSACQASFARPRKRCTRCALPLPLEQMECGQCVAHPPPLDACFAAVDYAYPWPQLIARFKFQDQPGLAAPLAAIMCRLAGLAEALQQADRVLPMPLSRQRLAARGYNQALLMAKELARQLGATDRIDAQVLLRVQDTPTQNQLGRQARAANMQHALAIDPLRVAQLAGQHVLLVDDVMTSGASLHAAAEVLRRAGAARVSAVVLARTPWPGV